MNGDYTLLLLWFYAVSLVRILLPVGASALVLWFAFRRLSGGWRRLGLVTFVALFWIVDLVPGAVGFSYLCRRDAGLQVSTPIPGRPDIVYGDQHSPAIAARILYLAGRVEYDLEAALATRLGLLPGSYRFELVETAPSDCWNSALYDAEKLALCANVVRLETPGARYRFDVSEPADGETAAGPWALRWWAEKHQASVVDRTTGETLATATMLVRQTIPSVSGLISFEAAEAACPRGSTPDGLSYVLFPAAFPDLGGRGR